MDRRAKKSKQIFNINLKQSSRNVNNGLEHVSIDTEMNKLVGDFCGPAVETAGPRSGGCEQLQELSEMSE